MCINNRKLLEKVIRTMNPGRYTPSMFKKSSDADIETTARLLLDDYIKSMHEDSRHCGEQVKHT